MTPHWLFNWIDEFEISSGEQARRVLSYPGTVGRLHEIARDVPSWQDGDPSKGRAIVAGSTMDFSGRMSCSHAECQELQLYRLFNRVWHYFDTVIVEGPAANKYVNALEEGPVEPFDTLEFMISNDVSFLLRLRELGVVEYLDFRDKPHSFCTKHFEQHAADAGLAYILENGFLEDAASKLKAELDIKIRPAKDGSWYYNIPSHEPIGEVGGFYTPSKKSRGKKPTKAQIATHVVRSSAAALVYDIATSKWLSLPLAEEFSHLRIPKTRGGTPRESVIALSLPMPILKGMPLRDLMKLRDDMHPHFEKFQYALTLAIREQLNRDPGRENSAIAEAVSEEFIRPAFADIERGLLEAKRALSVKAGMSLTVGSVVSSIGLLSSAPLVIGAGLAAMGATLAGAHKHIEDRKDVATSDVYFYWKATQGRRE